MSTYIKKTTCTIFLNFFDAFTFVCAVLGPISVFC